VVQTLLLLEGGSSKAPEMAPKCRGLDTTCRDRETLFARGRDARPRSGRSQRMARVVHTEAVVALATCALDPTAPLARKSTHFTHPAQRQAA
jgi:hypothetical protein